MSTIHSVMTQPQGDTQDIVTREQTGHKQKDFFNQVGKNVFDGKRAQGFEGATRKSLTTSLEALSPLIHNTSC